MWFNFSDDELNFEIKREGDENFKTQNESELSEIELKLLFPFLTYSIYCTSCGKVFKSPMSKSNKHLKDSCATAELKPLDSKLLNKARDTRKPRKYGKRNKTSSDYEEVEKEQLSSTSYNSKSIDNIRPQKGTLFNIDLGINPRTCLNKNRWKPFLIFHPSKIFLNPIEMKSLMKI